MASEDREGQGGPQSGNDGEADPGDEVSGVATRSAGTAPKSLNDPRSPLFVAEHSERYERQRMIREYETEYNCRLIVMRDATPSRFQTDPLPTTAPPESNSAPVRALHRAFLQVYGGGRFRALGVCPRVPRHRKPPRTTGRLAPWGAPTVDGHTFARP